jgi:hypothetical protein
MTMARHFLNLADAQTVATSHLKEAMFKADECVAERAMCLFWGPPGNGKTFAGDVVLERLRAREDPPTIIDVTFSAGASVKAITVSLLEAVGETQLNDRERRRPQELLAQGLTEHLRDPTALRIDEAQRMSSKALEHLGWLWEHPQTDLCVLLCGGAGCWRTLRKDPQLEDRIWRGVEFGALSESDALEALPSFHWVFRGAEPTTLLRLHEQLTRGVFRRIARAAKTAAPLCRDEGCSHLTEEILDAVIELERFGTGR